MRSFDTSWHRFCTKEIQLLGSWAFTPDEVAQAMRDLHAIQSAHPWSSLHTRFPLSVEGVTAANTAANAHDVPEGDRGPGYGGQRLTG